MKDIWKKLLCALALVPCATLAVACNEPGPQDETPDTEQGTGSGGGTTSGGSSSGEGAGTGSEGGSQSNQEQIKANAYTTIHNEAKKFKNKENSYEFVTSSDVLMAQTTKLDREALTELLGGQDQVLIVIGEMDPADVSAMSAEEKTQAVEAVFETMDESMSMEMASKYKSIIGYNGTTHEGYDESYEFVQEGEELGEYVLEDVNYIKKVNDNLVNYKIKQGGIEQEWDEELEEWVEVVYPDKKVAVYVGDDMAEYLFCDILEQIPISEIAEHETLTSLIDEMEEELKTNVSDQYGLQANQLIMTLDLVNENDAWVFKVNMSAEDVTMNGEEMGMAFDGEMSMDLSSDMQLTFKDGKFVSAGTNMSVVASAEMEEVPGSPIPVGVEMTMEMRDNSLIEFKNFGDNDSITDFSEYKGEGEGYDIEKITSQVGFYIDDNYIDNAQEKEFGTVLELPTADEVIEDSYTSIEFIGLENAEISGWYLDRECTQEVQGEFKYGSYDKSLYAKLTPKANSAKISSYYVQSEEFGFYEGRTIKFKTVNGSETFDLNYFITNSPFVAPESYTFAIYVNDTLVDADDYAGFTLEAGKSYDIKIEYTPKADIQEIDITFNNEGGFSCYTTEIDVLKMVLTPDDPATEDIDETEYYIDVTSIFDYIVSNYGCNDAKVEIEQCQGLEFITGNEYKITNDNVYLTISFNIIEM